MDLDFIASMFAHEIAPATIARAVGVREARIKQVAEHPKFAKLVAAKRLEMLRGLVERAEQTSGLEGSILGEFETRVPFSETKDLIALYKVLLDARRAENEEKQAATQPSINLTFNTNFDMSRLVKPSAQLNEHGEVVSIGHRSLAPMASDDLEAIITQKAAANG